MNAILRHDALKMVDGAKHLFGFNYCSEEVRYCRLTSLGKVLHACVIRGYLQSEYSDAKITAATLHLQTRLDRSVGHHSVLQAEAFYFWWVALSRLKKQVAKWFVDQRPPPS